jgi:hypothetical protein
MRFTADHLRFKALCAIDEAVEACVGGPITRSFALRFALAYLYAIGDGERRHFTELWKLFGTPLKRDPNEIGAWEEPYIRGLHARGCLAGIIRGVGYPETPQAKHALTHAWRKAPSLERDQV